MLRWWLGAVLFVVSFPGWGGQGSQYVFGKVGVVNINEPSVDPLYIAGLTYGYNVTRTSSFELDVDKSISGGDASTGSGSVSMSSLTAGATYRGVLSQYAYVKGKLGATASSFTYSGNISTDDVEFRPIAGFGGGLIYHKGIGQRFIIEVEGIYVDQDVLKGTAGIHVIF